MAGLVPQPAFEGGPADVEATALVLPATSDHPFCNQS